MSLAKKSVAEFIGTYWRVFGGCGAAVLAAGIPDLGIGYAGVALAFGLTVLTMAFAIGHISGCHLNPAVSLGLAVAGRFRYAELPAYVVAQVLGAVLAAGVLYWIASGAPGGYDLANGLAANGYGEHSPHGYSMQAGFAAEVVLTLVFLFVILGATDKRAPAGFAPIAIGLCLTLLQLVSSPGPTPSVNPPRRPGPALRVADWALAQLWLFWTAPRAGAAIAGLVYRWFENGES